MRHDDLRQGKDFDLVDVAAIWPRPDGGIQAPLGALEQDAPPRPERAVPDVPAGIGTMIVAAYAGIVLAFFLTMARSEEATFMIAISGFYVLMFLGVPSVFLKLEDDRSGRPSLEAFMARGIDTFTGPTSGRAALVQIMIVPALLLVAISLIGAIGLAVLP